MCGYTLPMKKCGNSLRRDHPQNVYYPKYQTLRRFDDDTPIDPQNLHPISLAFLQKKSCRNLFAPEKLPSGPAYARAVHKRGSAPARKERGGQFCSLFSSFSNVSVLFLSAVRAQRKNKALRATETGSSAGLALIKLLNMGCRT